MISSGAMMIFPCGIGMVRLIGEAMVNILSVALSIVECSYHNKFGGNPYAFAFLIYSLQIWGRRLK